MDVASFVLKLLAIVFYGTFLFRLIVIFPRVVKEGKTVEKISHGLRLSFLFSFATRILVAT